MLRQAQSNLERVKLIVNVVRICTESTIKSTTKQSGKNEIERSRECATVLDHMQSNMKRMTVSQTDFTIERDEIPKAILG